MKHIQLYETFNSGSHAAVAVFMETQMAVGTFPKAEAERIYSSLRRQIPQNTDFAAVEIVDLPEDHDLIVVPMGGTGISSSNAQELESYTGQPVVDVVELGAEYTYPDDAQMIFKADPDANGFVLLDSSGQTRLVSVEDLENQI